MNQVGSRLRKCVRLIRKHIHLGIGNWDLGFERGGGVISGRVGDRLVFEVLEDRVMLSGTLLSTGLAVMPDVMGNHAIPVIYDQAGQGDVDSSGLADLTGVVVQMTADASPGSPENLSWQSTEPGVVEFSCDPPADPDVMGYNLYKGMPAGMRNPCVGEYSLEDDLVYQTGEPGWYLLTAVDRVGNESGYSNAVYVEPMVAAQPEPPGLVTADRGEGEVALSWEASPDSDVQYYKVYRSTSSDGVYAVVAVAMSGTSIVDGSVADGVDYYYKITAVTGEGEESEASGPAEALWVEDTGVTPPGLVMADRGEGEVALSWEASPDSDVQYYKVYRSTSSDGVYAVVAVAMSGTSIVDSSVIEGVDYYYKVTAVTGEGEESEASGPAGPVQILPVLPAVVVDDYNPDIVYSGNWDGHDDYTDRYRQTTHESISTGSDLSLTFTGSAVQLIGERQSWGGEASVYVDGAYAGDADFYSDSGTQYQQVVFEATSLTFGEHTIMLEVVDDTGWIYLDSVKYVTTSDLLRPAAPTGTSAIMVSDSEIDVSWIDSSDDESGFVIERAVEGGDYAVITSLAANTESYSDSGLAEGTTYYYRVYATSMNGSSDYSVKSSAMTDGVVEVIIDDADAGMVYDGDWTAQDAFTGRYNETTHETSGAGRSATYTFTGQSVKLLAERQPWGGSAEIYLDDNYVGLASFYSVVTEYQQIVFDSGLLTYGEHTLRLDSVDDGGFVYVDGIIIAS